VDLLDNNALDNNALDNNALDNNALDKALDKAILASKFN
jgi:hypothetical protein